MGHEEREDHEGLLRRGRGVRGEFTRRGTHAYR
jgi:hypothetical protein